VARQTSQTGFILVAVLLILVVLSLLAAGVASTASVAVSQMAREQETFQAELDRASTRETLLVMLATQRRTLAGIQPDYVDPLLALGVMDEDASDWLPTGTEIRIDGRPYRGLGTTDFAVIDDRGRISVNWAPAWLREALYRDLGALPEQWGRLHAILMDYQDGDSLRRLDGAEEDEYRRLALPAPANQPLTSPLELRDLPVWRDLLAPLSDEDLLRRLSVTREVSVNLNTAPLSVLAMFPGVGPANAARIVGVREAAPIVSLQSAQADFGIPLALEDALNLYANGSGDLILWDRRSGSRQVVHWTLTTLGNTGKPWRIEYEVTLPRVNQADQRSAVPTQAALLSAAAEDRS